MLAESLGERVAIIDTDPQKSVADWWRVRKLQSPAMAVCKPQFLAKALEAAASKGFTLVIVDTPPHAGQIAYLVAESVDFHLIPCRPAPFDLRAIGKTVDIIEHLNVPAGIVINAVPPNLGEIEAPMVRTARKVLARYNLPVAALAIPERPAFSHPMDDGRTYIEHYPTGRPAREIAALWLWVRKQMGNDQPQAHPQSPAQHRAQSPGAPRAAVQPAPRAAVAAARGGR